MLKFLLASAMASVAHGTGIINYAWPGNGGTANAATTSPFTVTDPIGTNNNVIEFDTNAALGTYIGLFSVAVPTSHTVLATGGPVTSVACAGATTECTLPLYKSVVTDPVPEGTYYAMHVNGNDLNYQDAINMGGTAVVIQVVIDPYIYAWGSASTGTMQTATSNNVERGTDLYVSWDGLSVGDKIEYRIAGGTIVTACPVDVHTITAAEAAVGRGTAALKTSGATTADLVGFAITGDHTISAVTSGTAASYASTAACTVGTLATVARTVTITESDTIAIVDNGVANSGGALVPLHQAGQNITVKYSLATATTSGTYVGLWKAGENPASHVVDVDYTAGHPLSAAFLPVGVSGVGQIELSTSTRMAAGNHIVYIFNTNDAYYEPLADTSYSTIGSYGPHETSTFTEHNTDITLIAAPTGEPTGQPSDEPSGAPTSMPTSPTGEPTGIPTSSPSFVEEPWGEYVWTEKRHRKAGMCENQCSGHGTCEVNGNCKCFKGLDGEDEWTGPDCSSRTCPFDFAWVGASINSNNLHPWAECSNKGICDRSSGECQCFTGYEGAACQRTVCPDNCNDQGTCWPEKHLASKAGRVYDAPWDAMKHVGCLCDAGYRGPACDQQECPSGADPLDGYGNEAGRDCSGRGICDYSNGICACFTGFFGTRCQHQTTVM
jgi:hypothetical protein